MGYSSQQLLASERDLKGKQTKLWICVGGTFQISFPRQHKKIRLSAHTNIGTAGLWVSIVLLYMGWERGDEPRKIPAPGDCGWRWWEAVSQRPGNLHRTSDPTGKVKHGANDQGKEATSLTSTLTHMDQGQRQPCWESTLPGPQKLSHYTLAHMRHLPSAVSPAISNVACAARKDCHFSGKGP